MGAKTCVCVCKEANLTTQEAFSMLLVLELHLFSFLFSENLNKQNMGCLYLTALLVKYFEMFL